MNQQHYYTDEKNAQIVIALLKAHGIKRVIASPGTTHMSFLGSIQYDPWFKIWSAVDERHAAFMALGMATESSEPVVLTCTGSTASRNYLPALTEAFYRKMPILVITGSKLHSANGNLFTQYVDRSTPPKDAIRYACQCEPVENNREARECEFAVNKAILELWRRGGGPVHINLETWYGLSFNTHELPAVRKLSRYFVGDKLPMMPADAKIAVYIGNHKGFSVKEHCALERFLCSYNAVAICDVTALYRGKRRISCSLVCSQGISSNPKYASLKPDLIIHIGEMSNEYSLGYFCNVAPVWRVSEDGEIRDRFGRLVNVFEMPESFFFDSYAADVNTAGSYYDDWVRADTDIRAHMPELPFSNPWIAQQVIPKIDKSSILHIGLSTSLQSWSSMLQAMPFKVYSNVGTCGIDGCVSTLIGASLCNPEVLHFGVVGDLTFFYDLNSLGNRHIGKNIRLLLINNGCGGLFHSPKNLTEQFADVLDEYMAAGGHFGSKSKDLVKHYATDLGFKYLTASTKEAFIEALPVFVDDRSEKPILLECFTDVANERAAWGMRLSIDTYVPPHTSTLFKDEVKKLVPQRFKNAIKELFK